MLTTDLQALYAELNARHFDQILPPCAISWSRRLTRTAGNIDVRRREIHLSLPLLVDAFASDTLFAPQHEICGVLCDSPQQALHEILKHEMIHLWLFVQGLPSGHSTAFRAKARELGQPKIRHEIALPAPTSGWIYGCARCGAEFSRRRRYGRTVACARCCKTFNSGKYDPRFKLKGRRIS